MLLAKRFEADNGDVYWDKKRVLWFLSILIPTEAVLGPILYMYFGQTWMLWTPVFFFYCVMPLLDWMIGEDTSNPPESVVPQLENDFYYRFVTFLLVPILIAAFVFTAWFVAHYSMSWSGMIAVIIANGAICGYGINLGHEMGHKNTVIEKMSAKLVLCLSWYGHFNVEHNRGHHMHVATPEDVASSKLGEPIYAFLLRELPGAFLRAFRLEKERLQRQNKHWLHPSNEVLQSLCLSSAIYTLLIGWLGWSIAPFLFLTAFWGAFQLTSANYIEHYGLKRKRTNSGRYERCQPHHSWNSNSLLSNWTLIHLQRHSDHHANPMRRYQSLRNFDNIPQLPTGYYGMFLLAYVPWLWFRVMDKRLMQVVDYDWERMNVLPSKQHKYRERLANEKRNHG